MAIGLRRLLDHLHQALPAAEGGLSDGQLLARFAATHDEAAFAALLRRHGGMVLGVARRIVGYLQDAEAALKPLREARDPAAKKRAAEALEKATKQLRERLK
jgi:hypothetical protein